MWFPEFQISGNLEFWTTGIKIAMAKLIRMEAQNRSTNRHHKSVVSQRPRIIAPSAGLFHDKLLQQTRCTAWQFAHRLLGIQHGSNPIAYF